mmetsp:Transcript_45644/g.93373  ORF Transcript_45644/g.93373 Transcript_45644/m.93373 type:complete len:420 (-) Transcript_45644:128-1387(-)
MAMPALEKLETSIKNVYSSHSLKTDRSARSYQSFQDDQDDSPSNPDPLGGITIEAGRSPRHDGSIASLSPHGDGSFGAFHPIRTLRHSESESSLNSLKLVERCVNIPWHVRGRAEAWEVARNQIVFMRKIGEGMGGVVFLCRWRGLDCAAKLLTNLNKGSVEYHDMVNEISTISHLRHPNLVLFLGAITVEQPLLILSEYMAGGSLEDRFSFKRAELGHPWKPPLALAFSWMMDLSRAVCFLHSCTCPVMHRDLKPANLLLTDDNRLKVSDFGLCKTLQRVKEDGTPYTMTGCTGTKRYMAPEVVLSNPNYNEKVDVYSMAMIFYYIILGERPFEATDPELISVLAATRGLRPDAARLRWPQLEGLVERMWAEDPEQRPSGKDIVDFLAPLKPSKKSSNSFDCNISCQVSTQCCRCSIM